MRKKLGQYFLRSRHALQAAAGALDVPSEIPVVEIGPGKGALTEYILKRYSSVIAVEKDSYLVAVLQGRFTEEISNGSLTVVEGDVRDNEWLNAVGNESYIIIANIPYYLTGSLIKDLLTGQHPPIALSLVVQKEVAERITKKNGGKESLLSLSVRLFGTPTYVKTVPRRSFVPQPGVDSAIITITNVHQPLQDVQDAFFKIVKRAFQEKRKFILKKFSEDLRLRQILQRNGVALTDRAEDIPFIVWFAAAKEYAALP